MPGERLLEGQWMLITGASKGLGRELAALAADAGANLILAARSGWLLEELKEELSQRDVECMTAAGDLADDDFIARLATLCCEKNLDILVNNAGIVEIAKLEEIPNERIDEVLALNLAAPIKLTRAVIGMFKERQRGTVVFINSAGGRKGVPDHTVYCASKFGITGFIESLKLEVKGLGIRILSAYPGKMATELFAAAGKEMDTAAFIPPREVAAGVMYLLGMSGKCSHAELSVDRKS